jgi:hypothetical protein
LRTSLPQSPEIKITTFSLQQLTAVKPTQLSLCETSTTQEGSAWGEDRNEPQGLDQLDTRFGVGGHANRFRRLDPDRQRAGPIAGRYLRNPEAEQPIDASGRGISSPSPLDNSPEKPNNDAGRF